MGNSLDSAGAPAAPPVPTAVWRFPTGAFVGALALVLCGGASIFLYAGLEGMSHGSRHPETDAIGYGGVALLLGAGALFAKAGTRAKRVPPTVGSGVIRAVGIVSYVFAIASAAIGLWALEMIYSLRREL